MSSILRALRKLEADSNREQDSSTIKTKQSLSRKTGISRDTYRLLSIILAVMLTAAAAWIILNSSKAPPETKIKEQSLEKPAAVSQQQSPSLKTESKNESQLSPGSREQSQPKSATAALATEKTTQPGTERTAEAARPEDKAGTQNELTRQTEHTQFILKGVLWSDKPGRRVALINDQYLNEGDVIDGATVIKIERRAVTLQAGEKEWIIRVKK